jgi:hypothetical protein
MHTTALSNGHRHHVDFGHFFSFYNIFIYNFFSSNNIVQNHKTGNYIVEQFEIITQVLNSHNCSSNSAYKTHKTFIKHTFATVAVAAGIVPNLVQPSDHSSCYHRRHVVDLPRNNQSQHDDDTEIW